MGRLVLHWVCVFALVAVALVGCQEVVKSTTYRFTITEAPSGVRSVGVQICQADTDNCEITDVLGRAEVTVPFNQEVAFTLEKEGYGSYMFGDVSDESRGVQRRLYPDDQLAAIADQLQTPYPWEGGIVGLMVVDNLPGSVAGITFTPVGSTIDMVGEPFYFDAEPSSQYSLDLEATTAVALSERQNAGLGLPLRDGGFTEVIAEEQQFEFGGTAGDCPCIVWGWPGDAPNRIRVPVRAGYTTYGYMLCD